MLFLVSSVEGSELSLNKLTRGDAGTIFLLICG
jgi:hypothetical protein